MRPFIHKIVVRYSYFISQGGFKKTSSYHDFKRFFRAIAKTNQGWGLRVSRCQHIATMR